MTSSSHRNTFKLSKTGYLMFENYYVDLDTQIPAPFIRVGYEGLNQEFWEMGPRMNNDETMVIFNGFLFASYCFQDLYFRKMKNYYATQRIDACKYIVDRNTAISDFVMEDNNLSKILDLIQSDPIYYLMIITKNKQGKTPLQNAIENNSPKIVELFLNNLQRIPAFKLSEAVYPSFGELFDMGVEAFRNFLSICYFQTEQMQMMKKLNTAGKEGVLMFPTSSSVLDNRFNKKFLTKKEDSEK
mmetsp:Transcript_12932/g.14847  ORF Transcript_12932/g.14847 Transcript_12932/m.14847 type:complete len:243 (+) Transcript_12932:3871-4599(+)